MSRRIKKIIPAGALTAAWMLFSAFLLLCAPAGAITQAAFFSILPIIGCGCLFAFMKSASPLAPFLRENRKDALLSAGLAALFLVMLSLPEALKSEILHDTDFEGMRKRLRLVRWAYLASLWGLYVPAIPVSVFFLSFFGLKRFSKEKKQADGAEILYIKPLRLYRPTLLIAAVSMLCVLSAWPSMNIGDAPTIWYFAYNNIWDEWHTAGYMAFVWALIQILRSKAFVNIVQAVLWIYINSYAIGTMKGHQLSRRACRTYAAAVVISFVPTFFLMVMIKDVMFSMSLFAFGLAVLRIVSAERAKGRDWVWLGVWGFGTSIFRFAGWVPVLTTIGGLLIYLMRQKRTRAMLCTAIAGGAIALSAFLLTDVWFAGHDRYVPAPDYLAYSVPMQMIAAVADSGVPIDAEAEEIMNEVMPVSRWAECYMHYHSDAVSRTYGEVGQAVLNVSEKKLGGKLVYLNWKFLCRYPGVYLTAFFDQNSLVWQMATPVGGYERSYLWYPAAEYTLDRPDDTQFLGFTALTNRYAEFLYAEPVLRPLVWRGGCANFLLVFAAAVLIKKGRKRELLALLPVCAVTLCLFVTLPAQEVRYIFPNLEYAAFFGVYALFAPTMKAEPRIPHPL